MARRSFRCYVEQDLGPVAWFFVNAILEWFLILVLFVDGFLSFFANQFAKFFELRIPCLLCTRVDHYLVHRGIDFYDESICEDHKRNVSCLGYCHVHKKLLDIRRMCESCLLSFATEKESDCNADTYKSLVGILRKDLELFVDEDDQINLALQNGSKDVAVVEGESNKSVNTCLCCGAPLNAKKPNNGGNVAQAPTPTPRAVSKNADGQNLDLPHIGYVKLKLMENESEIHDDLGDGANTARLEKQLKGDMKPEAVPLLPDGEEGEDRTPVIERGNRFFGIPLSDSASNTPRLMARLYRRSPLDRTEYNSAVESAEGSVPNEAENDTASSNQKRHVRIDRRSLMDLCMELDEERNASAVAANNAMAMITRLQTEKAAVQMEALQYQRMMEEQAEYDQEALQEMNDLLSKREEDVRVLEAELEAYREKYGVLREFSMVSEDEITENYGDLKLQSGCVSPASSNEGQNIEKLPNGDQPLHVDDDHGKPPLDRSLKNHPRLLGRLNDRKTQSSSGFGTHSSKPSGPEEIGAINKEDLGKELLDLYKRVKALEREDELAKAGNMIHNSDERGALMSDLSACLQKLTHLVSNPSDENENDS